MRSDIDGFERRDILIDGAAIAVHAGGSADGSGPPLLLLHGYPQTHMTWAAVAPRLAERFRVIIPDLPGYGESAPLQTAEETAPQDPDGPPPPMSKRALAARMVALMDALGCTSFMVLGHDRGARVAYRMALDHPQAVTRLGIVEVVPTAEMWDAMDAGMAVKTYHWSFLAQPFPLPERMIGADPVFYLDRTLASWARRRDLTEFPAASLASYRAQMADPARIHAMCEDYRAGWGYDRAADEADRKAGRRIGCPLHFLWAAEGFPARTGDPLAIWRRWAAGPVTGGVVEAGHFAQEEAPEAVLSAFLPFFAGERDA